MLFILLLLCPFSTTAIATTPISFKETLENYFREEPLLNGAIIGISIRTQSDGEILYEHNGNTLLRPASNLKLFTAAAALNIFGPDYQFITEIYSDHDIEDHTLNGNLYIRGKGDPTLLPKDLDDFAKKIKHLGIKHIKGDIVGDESWYDDVRFSIDLPWTDEQEYYGAPISALTLSPDEDYDAGTILIHIKPGRAAGKKASIFSYPKSNLVKIKNEVFTTDKKGKKEIELEREHGTNSITIKGTIPVNAPLEKKWISIWDPATYTLDILYQHLIKNGISVDGVIRKGHIPENASKLFTHKSMPLKELLIPFMKLSNNGHAEILIKEMGKKVKGKGTWEAGLKVLEDELDNLGIDKNALILRDGSGISHVNLAPANEITQLLYQVQKKNWFPIFKDSLPVGGEDNRIVGGTLRYRMKEPPLKSNVFAKTGTIATVSTLSGYIQTKSGNEYIFSILINGLKDEDLGKLIEDNVLRIIAES
jgi:serine-type D-Ala-D-Ala carboxypeptidase/endopeptidase (penicillin-binding protein 4)